MLLCVGNIVGYDQLVSLTAGRQEDNRWSQSQCEAEPTNSSFVFSQFSDEFYKSNTEMKKEETNSEIHPLDSL